MIEDILYLPLNPHVSGLPETAPDLFSRKDERGCLGTLFGLQYGPEPSPAFQPFADNRFKNGKVPAKPLKFSTEKALFKIQIQRTGKLTPGAFQ